tara:strand:- start:1745 stop:2452 length:708 start_codon:yes stop_codon:yes gene_type:complete
MKGFILTLSLALAFFASADDHMEPSTSEGAFTTFHVTADDRTKYTNYLKSDTSSFKAIGSTASGVCITNDSMNEMMVWSGFDNLEGALGGAGKYDPSQVSSRLASLRDPIYTATWKPLKNWRLEPGFERVGRVKVATENLNAFVAAMSKLEKGVQDSGHPNFFNGVFISIGGGKHESSTIMVRSVTRDGAAFGKILDQGYSGNAPWGDAYNEVISLVDEFVSDNIEICEQFYYGE